MAHRFDAFIVLDAVHRESYLKIGFSFVPKLNQTKLVDELDELYSDNNLSPFAVTSDRVRVLELLASHVAISLENASLHSDLQCSETLLAEGQRLTHTGSFGLSVASGDIYWSAETYNIFEHDRAAKPSLEMVLRRIHPAADYRVGI